MGLIVINYEEVYNQGEKFKQEATELVKIKSNLKQIGNDIKDAWSGDESKFLLEQYEKTTEYLDFLINFLDKKGELLTKISGLHEESEKETTSQIERSDLKDER